jgi:hypothetical protein
MTGGLISHNIISSPTTGITIGGHSDFPITNNSITGAAGVGTSGIVFQTMAVEPSGPLVDGNFINNFPVGITMNGNIAHFVGRGIGINAFENISVTYYSPSQAPLFTICPSGTQNAFNGQGCNTTFDGSSTGGNTFGPSLFSIGSPGAVTYQVGPIAGQCGTNCIAALYAPDAAQFFMRFRSPTYCGHLGFSTVSTVSQMSMSLDCSTNALLMNPSHAQFTVGLGTSKSTVFGSIDASPTLGEMWWVTDSSTNTWGATISGSGGNKVLALWNGANWTVMGK